MGKGFVFSFASLYPASHPCLSGTRMWALLSSYFRGGEGYNIYSCISHDNIVSMIFSLYFKLCERTKSGVIYLFIHIFFLNGSHAYLWSVKREPFHTALPGHYGLLSYLLDLYVSQSGKLLPLRSTTDFRPVWAYLRTLPLLFRKQSPQLNYPPAIVPDMVRGDQTKGWYFKVAFET